MGSETFEGCVLLTMDYRESDKIVSFLTPKHGRLDAIARGARKSHKRFGGHLELFSKVEVVATIRPGKDLHVLQQSRQIAAIPALRDDLLKFAIASYGGEVILRTAVSGDSDVQAYRVFMAWLGTLGEAPVGWEEAVLRAGQIRFMAIRGILGDPTACLQCGQSVTESKSPMGLQLPELGVVCMECSIGHSSVQCVASEVVRMLQQGVSGTLIRGAQSPPNSKHLKALGTYLEWAIDEYLGETPKSSAFLHQLLAPIG